MWTAICARYVDSVMHRWPRPAVFVVILMLCACSESKDAKSFSDTKQSTIAKDSTAPRQHAMSATPQRSPDPPKTSQPPSDVVHYEPWSPCVENKRTVGKGFMTPWGITLRDIQNAALGSHRMPVTWRHDEEISYGVEGTSTTLLVEITRTGPATFVERTGAMKSTGDHGMMAWDCSTSRLLMPVHVKAVTQDGVFSIEGDSELIATSRRSIVVTLYAAQHGTLQIRSTRDKDTVVDSLGITLGFRGKRTMVGAIGGGYACADFNCLHIPYAYACFPDRPPFQLDDFIFEACGSMR